MLQLLFSGLFGFLTGVVASVLGIGGGVMIVPFLALALGRQMHSAVGTSLFALPFGAASASVRYGLCGLVEWRMAALLAALSVPGGLAGHYVCNQLRSSTLSALFAMLLFLVGLRMLLAREGEVVGWFKKVWFLGAFGAGFCAGLFGVGGGFLNVPILHALGRGMKVSVATSSVVILLTSVAAGAAHYIRGGVDVWCGTALGLGLVAGAFVGATVLPKIRSSFLRLLFAGVVFVVSARMLLQALLT
ncbi:MAG: hypothetical protein DRP82_04015 [Planctomycetota bacterium]|nr:MAG: hypothetical protein DRP82_04015 [Planctomycetota bacterium]